MQTLDLILAIGLIGIVLAYILDQKFKWHFFEKF